MVDCKNLMEQNLDRGIRARRIFEIMDGAAQQTFEREDAADFAYEIPDVSRFRVNAFRHLNGIGAIFRAIPSTAMSLEELNMPKVVHELCKYTLGHDPRDRQDRLRQVHDAGGNDRRR